MYQVLQVQMHWNEYLLNMWLNQKFKKLCDHVIKFIKSIIV